jgi:excisionase family DNA binding protein
MSTKIDDDALYDVPGLAQILGVTEKTIRKLLGDGNLKGKKLGRKWYVTGATLKAYFEGANEKELEIVKKRKEGKK